MPKPWGQPLLSIRLPADELRRLKYLSRQRTTTVTELVRALILEHLEASGVKAPRSELLGQTHLDV